MTTTPRAPATLEGPEKELWKRILQEMEFNTAELSTLQMGLEALGEHRRAMAIIAKEGLVIQSDGGLVRKHPATEIAKNARAAWIATVRTLRLATEEEPARVGRPPGGRKNKVLPHWAAGIA
ncbi:MAG: P27 family phage terminase small subunit [Acidobacteriota bacterium]|nr:P27 family phage terminase small subunit [Acidobacteriota bacterium]